MVGDYRILFGHQCECIGVVRTGQTDSQIRSRRIDPRLHQHDRRDSPTPNTFEQEYGVEAAGGRSIVHDAERRADFGRALRGMFAEGIEEDEAFARWTAR